MTAVLGDFLGPAAEHIARATACSDGQADAGLAGELGRVIAALGRYLGDLAVPDEARPDAPDSASPLATARTRQALRRSALTLRQAARTAGPASPPATHPATGHLAAAATQLAAGHDLLLDRRDPGPPGPRTSASARAGRFYWAATAGSAPVAAALLAEITGHARALAPWTAQLTGAAASDETRAALHDAARWLYTAAGSASAWQQHRSLPPGARAALYEIPVLLIPARRPPGRPETTGELCDGIAGTAARLRHAAVELAPDALTSPAASALSWRRHARATAITTHASYLILRALAARATQLGIDPALRDQLIRAARLSAAAWPAQRATGHIWDRFTTGDPGHAQLTPVAAEIDDLVLRAGRLAYHNPGWAPGLAQAAPPRKPHRLAPALRDIRSVAAAVHHAADAITIIGAADREAIEQAAQAGRVYMPAWTLAVDSDLPYRYVRCPPRHARRLLTTYDNANRSAAALTASLDELAVSHDLSSAALAAPRRNPAPRSGNQPDVPGTDLAAISIPEAGQVGKMLHDLRISEPTMLTRADLADATALDLIAEATAQASRRNDLSTGSPRRLHVGQSRGRTN
ncbi:MAG TPA: hypothetical protein VMU94_27625 [Streptosporangiaceae bacterium]|nr:hypothetical protein [Streptosporangiaceae bacterium]